MKLGLLLCLVGAAACSAACSKAGEEQTGKRAPIPPPPDEPELPADLNIPVEIDGAPSAPVTGKTLAALEPDFADRDRRAWRLTRVLPAYVPGAAVEALSRDGVSIVLPRPATAEEMQPVLFVTRRGDVVATLVKPEDPFPDFHGQGGRLRRPGDLTPRVTPVVKLRVHSKGVPAPSPAP